ncbi:small oligopeptide transporter [Mycena leptocephala]|nr:small oligopeptide transporter [Mycena leptocephala]
MIRVAKPTEFCRSRRRVPWMREHLIRGRTHPWSNPPIMTDIGDIAASPFSPKARENPSANENAPGEKILTGAQFDDPNLDKEHIMALEDESPYPEVRSAVANTDDPDMPTSTIRTWGLNQFFFFRFPSVNITGIVAQLLSYPMGRAAAAFIPNWSIFGVPLNPHVLITVSFSWPALPFTDFGADFCLVAVQRVYYGQIYNFSFAIGGVARRFLVAPPSMIWPANLVNCALFNTLHAQEYAGVGGQGGVSRGRFFLYAFLGSFAWCEFVDYVCSVVVTWIRPNNTVIAQLFGYSHGMGMSVLTFDWSQITYDPGGLRPTSLEVFFAAAQYDNQMRSYNVTAILTPESTLDEDAYHKYSPLFLSTTFAVSYGKQIWTQSRRAMHEQPDIHARLMSRYPQVPEWWYLILFVSMFVLGIISIEVWPTQMPVWAFVVALLISFVYTIPIGMIQAITNQQIGLNVITELIVGYALPGRPIAMMMFKTWGYITMAQALTFTSDFKLGHYMKIPPRQMFWSQILATVVSGTVQLGVQAWMFTNIDNFCAPDQKDGFICPSTEVFGTASIIVALVFFFLVGAAAPLIAWALNKRYPNSFLKYVNPVIFNGAGFIPPATALNYVPWAVVGFIFQYVIRRWSKYNYVLSAALDAGLAVSILFIFFTLQFPKNGTIGLTTIQAWWGNTVCTKYLSRLFPKTIDIPGFQRRRRRGPQW